MSCDQGICTCDNPPQACEDAPQQSAVLDLLDTVWSNWGQATPHCWDRVNHAMQAALSLAIGSGMKFGLHDFEEISRRYRFHYWGGDYRGGFAEGFYALAVTEGNLSAARAFETWKGRKPFIMDSVRPDRGASYVHRVSYRQRGRVAVGFQFYWHDRYYTVTSFHEDGSGLVACTYKPVSEEARHGGRKIDKRIIVTQADVRDYRRLLKKSA
jgi:hypothetical protein